MVEKRAAFSKALPHREWGEAIFLRLQIKHITFFRYFKIKALLLSRLQICGPDQSANFSVAILINFFISCHFT